MKNVVCVTVFKWIFLNEGQWISVDEIKAFTRDKVTYASLSNKGLHNKIQVCINSYDTTQ